jgi:hypothetical protein
VREGSWRKEEERRKAKERGKESRRDRRKEGVLDVCVWGEGGHLQVAVANVHPVAVGEGIQHGVHH